MTTTEAPISEMTPRAIDERLAALDADLDRAEARRSSAISDLHYTFGERPERSYGSRRVTWPSTSQQVLDRARAIVEAPGYVERQFHPGDPSSALRHYDEATALAADIERAMAPLDAEYRVRPWSRFFKVPDGHIHSSMSCQTCNHNGNRTQFGWLPELSGMSMTEAIGHLDRAAHILCTVCFPAAPLEWTKKLEKPSCPGSGEKPVKVNDKFGRNKYGECPGCHDWIIVTSYGVIRKHPPAKAK